LPALHEVDQGSNPRRNRPQFRPVVAVDRHYAQLPVSEILLVTNTSDRKWPAVRTRPSPLDL